ncbi:MAG: NAD(P)-dependent oxidoreductase [Roseivirga sp.]
MVQDKDDFQGYFRDKRVLITGGTGFIGSALARRIAPLAQETHLVLRDKSSVEKLSEVQKQITFHKIELSKPGSLLEELSYLKPDYIFHFAQPSPEKVKTIEGFLEAQPLALSMMANVLEFGKEQGVGKILHACSSTIYSTQQEKAISENSVLRPNCIRGLIKSAERNLCLFYASYHNLPVVLGRVFRAYGPWDSEKKLIVQALTKYYSKQPLQLVSDLPSRDYIHVDDIADYFMQLCVEPTEPGAEFNMGSGRALSASEIVSELNTLLHGDILIDEKEYPISAMDRQNQASDQTKTLNFLKRAPKTDLKTGLQGVIDWYEIHRKQ